MDIADVRNLYAEDLYQFSFFRDYEFIDFIVRAPTFTLYNRYRQNQDYQAGRTLLEYCVVYPSQIDVTKVLDNSPAILDEILKLIFEYSKEEIDLKVQHVIDSWNETNENFGGMAERLLTFFGKDLSEENYIVGLMLAETMACIRAQAGR